MSSNHLNRLRARARAVRTRAAVRSWQYRQRNLAAGVWFRLRRLLADAKAAYVIPDEAAQQLLVEGRPAEACGAHVTPVKTIVFVDEDRLSTIEGRRPIRVALGPDFMAACAIALVPFEGTRSLESRG